MSNFEERIRRMALLSPNVTVGAAVTIADRLEKTGDEVIPFPDDQKDAAQVALWASQIPSVLDLIAERKYINAIKEIREQAPRNENGRYLDLLTAKRAMEALRVMM